MGSLGDLSVARVAGRIAAISFCKNASAGFPTELKPVSSNCNAIEVSSPQWRRLKSAAGTVAARLDPITAAFVFKSGNLLDCGPVGEE